MFTIPTDKIYFHYLTKNKSSEPLKLTAPPPTSFVALFPPQETEHSFFSNSLLGCHPSHHRPLPQTIFHHPLFPSSCPCPHHHHRHCHCHRPCTCPRPPVALTLALDLALAFDLALALPSPLPSSLPLPSPLPSPSPLPQACPCPPPLSLPWP